LKALGVSRSYCVQVLKQTFVFTAGEILHEFLISTGYLAGVHDKECPVLEQWSFCIPPGCETGDFFVYHQCFIFRKSRIRLVSRAGLVDLIRVTSAENDKRKLEIIDVKARMTAIDA